MKLYTGRLCCKISLTAKKIIDRNTNSLTRRFISTALVNLSRMLLKLDYIERQKYKETH